MGVFFAGPGIGNDAEAMQPAVSSERACSWKRSRSLRGVVVSRKTSQGASEDAHAAYRAGCLNYVWLEVWIVKRMGKEKDKGWSREWVPSSSEDRGGPRSGADTDRIVERRLTDVAAPHLTRLKMSGS